MVVTDIKENIIAHLDQVDEATLMAVQAFLTTYVTEKNKPAQEEVFADHEVIGYELDGTPITAAEFAEQADAIVERMDKGEYITLEELIKKKTAWLESIK